MEEKNINQQIQSEGSNSNIIFGTSSDDIQEGLHNNQFIDTMVASGSEDKDQIVNEEEQNEIVNPSEETFTEEPTPQTTVKDNTTINEAQTHSGEPLTDSESEKDPINETGKISKAED